MSYNYRKRPDTGRWEIFGPDPRPWKNKGVHGFRKTTRATSANLVKEEAATLYAQHAREALHGPGRPDRKFAEIAEAYLEFEVRHTAQRQRVLAIVSALGDVAVSAIDQEAVDKLQKKLIRKSEPSPSTVRALVSTPLIAVLNFGFRRRWCDKPVFERPRQRKGKTLIVTPGEAQHIIECAAPHQQPILLFLAGTGCRVAEALKLTWEWNHEDGGVDLVGGRARLMQKSRRASEGPRERIVMLPPAIIAMLANLASREGRVFQWQTNVGAKSRGLRQGAYAAKKAGTGGGQLKTGFNAAVRRAGLAGRGITPHTFRHSWASWHYAIHKDLALLKEEGGWETLSMVERYRHRLEAGHEEAVLTIWGYPASLAGELSHAIYTRITRTLDEFRLRG